MENTQSKSQKNIILSYLWQNILVFVLSILGPMFFLLGMPPFIMSIMGIIYARQAMVFDKKNQPEKSELYTEMSGNYARFSLWWIFWIYMAALIFALIIKFTMPYHFERIQIFSPAHTHFSQMMSPSSLNQNTVHEASEKMIQGAKMIEEGMIVEGSDVIQEGVDMLKNKSTNK